MKIEGPKGPNGVNRAGPAKKTIGTGNFASLLSTGEAGEAVSTPPTIASSAVGGLFALQGQSEGERKKRAIAIHRAEETLSLLDQITYALLNQNVTTAHLARLKALAGAQYESVNDPRLSAVLDEIDLRLAVEAAKLEKAAESLA